MGSRLVKALLQRGSIADAHGDDIVFDELVVSDLAPPAKAFAIDERLKTQYGDFTVAGALEALVNRETSCVFHLAAVVSGEAEKNFEKGVRVNLHGAERLLNACRSHGQCPRFVFASSAAVYGGKLPTVIDDHTLLSPQTSYGSHKAMGELMINDYSRKGFVDGRSLRLPTVVVRPGKPNAAASSFASSIIREPLQGQDVICPVASETKLWISSPRQVVQAFLHAAQLPAKNLGTQRALILPGMTTTVEEMLDGLRQVAGADVAQRVRFQPDPFIEKIVYDWATQFDPARALALGFTADPDPTHAIRAFIEDELVTAPMPEA